MDSPSNKTPSTVQTRQKRILPSRSRRGGPGVGSCDVDQMILDTYKRQAENEPLIPAATRFLLTTDSRQVPSSSSSSNSNSGHLHLNLVARERYFDRPEVIKAYREQLTIETPEYTSLSEDASVGGRFRPRSAEDAAIDTSDTAYEKRHRKYETFEKRQRLREKEKLKHEQYKLKERIEQLRAMDGAAFLSLPASSFSLTSSHSANNAERSEGTSYLPGAHVNGAAAYNEGERRRKEMLDVALALEERYRVLLPPDRMKKPLGRAATVSEPDIPAVSMIYDGPYEGETEVEPEDEPQVQKKEVEKLKLKIKFPPRSNNLQPHSPQPAPSPKLQSQPPSKKIKYVPATPKISSHSSLVAEAPTSPISARSATDHASTQQPDVRVIYAPSPVYSNPEIAVLENASSRGSVGLEGSHSLAGPGIHGRPTKRMRNTPRVDYRESSLPPIASISAPAAPKQTTPKPSHVSHDSDRPKSVLLVAALRTSSMPKSGKARRHLTAFGTKVPPEVDEQKEFELPEWIRSIRDVDDGWDHPASISVVHGYHPPHDVEASASAESKVDSISVVATS